jgi:hypothetical protein
MIGSEHYCDFRQLNCRELNFANWILVNASILTDRNHFTTMTTAPIQIPRSHMAKQIVGTKRAGMLMRAIGFWHKGGLGPIGGSTIGQLRQSDR